MRDTGSLGLLTGIPLLVALVAVMPFAARPRTAAPSAPPAVVPVQETADVPSPGSFHEGRTLVAEVEEVPEGRPIETDSLRVLVALLPDPDESSLDWMYDAHLASIRRALERIGYLADRTWMPPPGERVAPPGESGAALRPAPDVLPGVMVFRGKAGRSTRELTVVYIVGELPTAGVHRGALHTAIREARELMPGPADTLLILGPTFSGSAPSLRAVLEAESATDPCRPVHVVTGSATSSASRALLSFSFGARCLREAGSKPEGVRFDATVHTDAEYSALIADRLLTPLKLEAGDVALLTEANTVYGKTLAGKAPQKGAAASGEAAGAASEWRGSRPYMLDSAIVVTFPLNIASVRGAYEKNPEPTSEAGGAPPVRSSRLPLDLETDARPQEAPSARSRLTAPALDRVVQDMLATLRSRHVRAVGILASDVRDKLFLAEIVRQALPDVLLFTFEGNALYAREDLVGSLRGMVVASSYPLILENVTWTEGRSFVPFSTEGAAGVFNAAVDLMGRRDLVQEYRAPLGRALTARVPLWLTTVGSGTLLPLTVVNTDDDPQVPPAMGAYSGRSRTQVRLGLLDGVSVVLGVLLVFGGALVLLRLGRGTLRVVRHGDPDGADGEDELDMNRLVRSVLRNDIWLRGHNHPRRTRAEPLAREWEDLDRLAFVGAMLAFITPLGIMNGTPAAWSVGSAWMGLLGYVLFYELVSIAALLAVALVRHAVRLWRSGAPGPRLLPLLTNLIAHGLCLLLAVYGFVYSWQLLGLAADSPTDYGLYRFRTLRMDSGTSALLPLLLASVVAALLLGWHRDRRFLLWGETRQNLEPLALDLADAEPGTDIPRALSRVVRGIVRVREHLELRVDSRRVVVASVVAVLMAIGLGRVLSFRTLENVTLGPAASTTWILWTGLIAGFLGVIVITVHIAMVGLAFRTFLQALASTPLAGSFSRLPTRLRIMGRLHLLDPSSDRMAGVLAESGHEAVWSEAAELDDETLVRIEVTRVDAKRRAQALQGQDEPGVRRDSLEALIGAARRAWAVDPERVWQSGWGTTNAEGEGPDRDHTALGTWLKRVEDLLALEGALYVDWVLRNIRRIALLLLMVMLFTTGMLEAVPFPNHSAMTTLFVVLVGVAIATVLALMIQLAQDDILSRITGTEPGKVNWNGGSLLNALVFVAVPVLSLLGAEVAPVGRSVFGWLKYVLRALSAG